MKIFYTTNAGVYISSGRAEVLVDGIHDAAAVGFEPMADAMNRELTSDGGVFAGEGLLLFTHLHKDHYDAGKTRRYLEQHPQTALWGPGLTCRGVEVTADAAPGQEADADAGVVSVKDERADEQDPDESGFMYGAGKMSLRYGDMLITAYKTKHSGENFHYIPHYSFLIKNTGSEESVFIAGDAVFDPELAEKVRADCGAGRGPMTFVTAYQLIEPTSRAFLEKLAPERLFLIHQPAAGSEAGRSLTAIADYIRKYPPKGIRVEEPEPMSWIELSDAGE